MDRMSLAKVVWRKSSFSGSASSNCVEVGRLPGGWMAVRDSKDRSGPALLFTPGEWDAFTDGVRAGEFG
jgi:hypothetical protein